MVNLRILGIDPGYAILGYGVVERTGTRLVAIDYGVVETSAKLSFPERLEKLYLGTKRLIELHNPDEAVFEELFFYRNTTTAISVGAGRGVSILAAEQCGLPLFEYTPMQIKLSVAGDGHADKQGVQRMVRALLGLAKPPQPDDAADALAAAICHANTMEAAKGEYRIR